MVLGTLRKRVLEELGVLARGQTPNSADDEHVSEAYTSMHAEYSQLDLVNWGSSDDVPDLVAQKVIRILAGELSGRFRVPMERKVELEQGKIIATRELRRLVSPVYQTTQTSFPDY